MKFELEIMQDTINQEVDGLDGKLEQSAELQKSFDHYNFNWGGGKKASAEKEASAEIKRRHSSNESDKIREVFQNEKFSQLTRSWCTGIQHITKNFI